MRAERARLSRNAETAPDQQCRRAGAARDRNRPQGLAVRRLRRGGERAASTLTLIETARLNGIDPQAWLADALRRIADHPVSRLNQLLAGIGKTASIKLLLCLIPYRAAVLNGCLLQYNDLAGFIGCLFGLTLKGCPRRTAAASNWCHCGCLPARSSSHPRPGPCSDRASCPVDPHRPGSRT